LRRGVGAPGLWLLMPGASGGLSSRTTRHAPRRLVAVGAEDLAAVARGESLPDADLGAGDHLPDRTARAAHADRHARARVELPGANRVLDEANRPVHERDIDTT